jgi:hypothetical protein
MKVYLAAWSSGYRLCLLRSNPARILGGGFYFKKKIKKYIIYI